MKRSNAAVCGAVYWTGEASYSLHMATELVNLLLSLWGQTSKQSSSGASNANNRKKYVITSRDEVAVTEAASAVSSSISLASLQH